MNGKESKTNTEEARQGRRQKKRVALSCVVSIELAGEAEKMKGQKRIIFIYKVLSRTRKSASRGYFIL